MVDVDLEQAHFSLRQRAFALYQFRFGREALSTEEMTNIFRTSKKKITYH